MAHSAAMLRARPRVPTSSVLTAVLALIGMFALPSGAAARVPEGFAGMVISSPVYPPNRVDLSQQLDAMVASGVESVRVVFNWSYAQPYQSWARVPSSQKADFTTVGGVPTRFDQIDKIVALAAERHLTILPIVMYAPSWDSAPHPRSTYARPASAVPYANFATALVQRYGPNGSFWSGQAAKVPIRMWQVWNEPNLMIFWPRQPFARSYLSLLRVAHDAIKRADPGARVVLAGLANHSWTALSSIYHNRGARQAFDVAAIHPYTKEPRGVIKVMYKARRVMNRAGDKRKPMVVDEFGWPSAQGEGYHRATFDFVTTPRGQARNLGSVLPMLARNRGRLRLLGFYYYTWAGIERRGEFAFDYSGLFRIRSGEFFTKPAYYSFRRAVLHMERCGRKGLVADVCVQSG